jgi:uncharacterized membrane protein
MASQVNEMIWRSFVKSIAWRIVGVITLGCVTFFYTRQWVQTSWITFLHHGVFLFIFVGHERFWLHCDYTGTKRKLLKCFTYETILGNFVLGIICLIITGNVQKMSQITLTYIAIKHVMYVFNEFIWDKIKWGRG